MWKGKERGPQKINIFFETYKKKLRPPQKTVVRTFQEVVKDLLGVTISENSCSYTVSTKTLTITTNGPTKTEILLRKKEILDHIKGRIGEKGAPEEIL
jgi:hypothetical protein